MIGIVVALNSEAQSLIDCMEPIERILLAGKDCFVGKFAKYDVALVISGIGKVNAAIATQAVIDKFLPEFILNFGTCGGMNESVEILKYYLADKCAQFDFDLRELDGVPLGYIQDYDRVFFPAIKLNGAPFEYSTLASADRFTNDEIDIKAINDMGASLRDMEGGSVAQVCLANSVPLFVLKGITDVYGSGTAQEQFYVNLQTVCKNFSKNVKILLDFIKSISVNNYDPFNRYTY